jgi:hypothetical protein
MTPTSGIEFLVWLLIAAAIIAMLTKRLKIPYAVIPGLGQQIDILCSSSI